MINRVLFRIQNEIQILWQHQQACAAYVSTDNDSDLILRQCGQSWVTRHNTERHYQWVLQITDMHSASSMC